MTKDKLQHYINQAQMYMELSRGEGYKPKTLEEANDLLVGLSYYYDEQTKENYDLEQVLFWYASIFEKHPTQFALDMLRKDEGKKASKAIGLF